MASIFELKVDENTLQKLGWTRVSVSHTASASQLAELFSGIDSDPQHRWARERNRIGLITQESLHEFENQSRPTKIFYYYAHQKQSSVETLFATGAVAERVSWSYPLEGFPVLSRCFIRNEFKDTRLYFPILKHRVDYCFSRWSHNLLGVHMGSANPAINSAIQHNYLTLPFRYMGEEQSAKVTDGPTISDYLLLTEAMKEGLLVDPHLNDQAESVAWSMVKEMIAMFVANQFDERDFNTLCTIVENPMVEKILLRNPSHKFKLLFDFFLAVPILRIAGERIPRSKGNSSVRDRRKVRKR